MDINILQKAREIPVLTIQELTGLSFPEEAKAIHREFLKWLRYNDRYINYTGLKGAWRSFWKEISICSEVRY